MTTISVQDLLQRINRSDTDQREQEALAGVAERIAHETNQRLFHSVEEAVYRMKRGAGTDRDVRMVADEVRELYRRARIETHDFKVYV